MTFTPPQKILVTSDDSEMEFLRINKIKTEIFFVYKYLNGEKKELEAEFTEKELSLQLSNYFKEI